MEMASAGRRDATVRYERLRRAHEHCGDQSDRHVRNKQLQPAFAARPHGSEPRMGEAVAVLARARCAVPTDQRTPRAGQYSGDLSGRCAVTHGAHRWASRSQYAVS
jgi:hypothetical protein